MAQRSASGNQICGPAGGFFLPPGRRLASVARTGRAVAQVAVAPGQAKSSSFFIDFSGFKWRVRFRPSDRGGTSNPYNPENVYTDRAGALHLQIVNRK